MVKTKASGLKVIGVAQGVNLDLLGSREASIYGTNSLSDIETRLRQDAVQLTKLFDVPPIEIEFFQSNSEADYLGFVARPFAGLIINPGAWTHTSLALADRLRAVGTPFIETHISNIAAREAFRHQSFCAPHAAGVIFGLGIDSYRAALFALLLKIKDLSN